jgi:hypothetical protein
MKTGDSWGSRNRSSISSLRRGRARLPNSSIVSTAFVLRYASDLHLGRRASGLRASLARTVMRGGGLCRRIAHHRTHHPRHRQRGENGQHEHSYPVLPAHDSSIPRAAGTRDASALATASTMIPAVHGEARVLASKNRSTTSSRRYTRSRRVYRVPRCTAPPRRTGPRNGSNTPPRP